jgi:predicted nucleic acid-binding protein
MIALDTCAVIDFCRGSKKVLELLEKCQEPIVITAINEYEILKGLLKSKKEYQARINHILNNIIILSSDSSSAKASAQIYQQLKEKGEEVSGFDALIAGTLIANNVTKLVTANTRHFSRIGQLKIIEYEQ